MWPARRSWRSAPPGAPARRTIAAIVTSYRAPALAPVAENSLPGLRPRNQTSRRGVKLAKSNRASGLRARVRPEGVGDSCHRWYEPQTGRYTKTDPLGLGSLQLPQFGLSELDRGIYWQQMLLTPAMRAEYGYSRENPIRFRDPDGRISPSCADDQGRRSIDIAKAASNEPGFPGGPDGRIDGPADAYRHCVWSCLMVDNCSAGTATAAGWWNEARRGFNDSSGQDTYNNDQGRDCGGACDGCETCCRIRLDHGLLQSSPDKPAPAGGPYVY